MRGRIRSGVQHLVNDGGQSRIRSFGSAELMNKADAQGFLGGEALAREEIAAQAARVDRTQKERNERPRREAEPHLRQREERVVRGDDDVTT